MKTKNSPNNFGGLRNDGNKNTLTGLVGNYLQTIDGTGTPLTSPLTVNTTATLVVPSAAALITICSVTNAVQVSEDSTQTAFFTLPAGVPFTFDVANQQNLYLKTGSSTVVSFIFNMI
jgi:hypothetical protein